MKSDSFLENKMDDLKSKLKGLCAIIPKDKPVIFVGYPMHHNVGDSIITFGTEMFFKANCYSVVHRSGINNFPAGFKVTDEHTIVLQGGGNFGDLYYKHDQQPRERIVQSFPKNKIVLLPQSIDYQDDGLFERSMEIFNAHNDMHICVRDDYSFSIAENSFKNVYRFPDMAQYLWREIPVNSSASKSRLYFLRRDDESTEIPKGLNINKKELYDWCDIFSAKDRRIQKFLSGWAKFQGGTGLPISPHKLWYEHSEGFMRHSISFFSQYESVATNRLHGCILSLLLNKEVKAFDNTNKKISAYCDTWELNNIIL